MKARAHETMVGLSVLTIISEGWGGWGHQRTSRSKPLTIKDKGQLNLHSLLASRFTMVES